MNKKLIKKTACDVEFLNGGFGKIPALVCLRSFVKWGLILIKSISSHVSPVRLAYCWYQKLLIELLIIGK